MESMSDFLDDDDLDRMLQSIAVGRRALAKAMGAQVRLGIRRPGGRARKTGSWSNEEIRILGAGLAAEVLEVVGGSMGLRARQPYLVTMVRGGELDEVEVWASGGAEAQAMVSAWGAYRSWQCRSVANLEPPKQDLDEINKAAR